MKHLIKFIILFFLSSKVCSKESIIAEFLDNKMLVLTTSAKNLKNFDNSEISEMIKATENSMAKEDLSDKKKYILFHKLSALKDITQ